ncbi:MAG: hypothetical protein JWR69_3301, partial [Pedosphaera sp.]|nr:hypothetical protein [Pedosphaera sp.]
MNRLLFTGMLIVAGARGVLSQPSPAYVNTTTINSPPQAVPQVYALNFTNLGTINLNLNTFSISTIANSFFVNNTLPPFDFTSVNYYTNRGTLTCDTGFTFDTAPSGAPGDGGGRHMAGNFGNANVGVVSAGSLINFQLGGNNIVFFGGSILPQLQISATNVVNRGLLNVGLNGMIKIGGKSVDLSRGSLNIEGLDFAGNVIFGGGCFEGRIVNAGIFD